MNSDRPLRRVSARLWRAQVWYALGAMVFASGVCHAEDESRFSDFKYYVTSPLHWDGADWLTFGGAVAAIGIAHRYDDDVRTHFLRSDPTLAFKKDTNELRDFIPAAAALGGTWMLASLWHDHDGKQEAASMAEASAFALATAYGLKLVAGRERPNETADSSRWRESGNSFPSFHSTAAFAIGTVLAESGNDQYRWVRRALGYGIGVYSGYQRLKHNQHWLSDVVAGSALGFGAARFVLNRDEVRDRDSRFALLPTDDGGVLLSFSYALH